MRKRLLNMQYRLRNLIKQGAQIPGQRYEIKPHIQRLGTCRTLEGVCCVKTSTTSSRRYPDYRVGKAEYAELGRRNMQSWEGGVWRVGKAES